MPTGTVRFHRVLKAPPERVYRAFLEPDAMVRWLPPYGFTAQVHQMEARVGGRYRMSFTNFSSGHSHAFGGEYLELVPNERIRNTDRFDDANLPGEMVNLRWFDGSSATAQLASTTTSNSPVTRSSCFRPSRTIV